MRRFRRFVLAGALVVGAGLACDQNPVTPSTTGRIQIVLLSGEGQPAAVPPDSTRAAAQHDAAIDAVAGQSLAQAVGLSPAEILALDAVRVSVTGPTAKTVTQTTASGGFFDVTVDQLAPGSYTVFVEGLISNEVDFYGSTSATVTAGQTASASVSFTSFVPSVPDFSAATTTLMTLSATWPAVTNATGYIVQTANNAAFSGQTERSVTSPTVSVSLPDTGSVYLRVRAANGRVPAGRASTARTTRILKEAGDTSDAPALAADLGFGSQATTITRASLNIAPAGDIDWFWVKVCSGDSVIANARAVRLTPASTLNTLLQVFDSTTTTTPAATNDDTDSTDAEIRYLAAITGRHRIRVTAATGASGSATTGHYDLVIQVKAGARNTGTACRGSIDITPNSDTLTALGATRQLSARLLDSDGNEITGAAFTWQTSNGAIATVNASGLVTAVANGSATITASSGGVSGTRPLTVRQLVSNVAVSPGGTTITTLGGTEILSAQPRDANNNAVPGKTVTWATLNPAVATVNATNGTVTAVTAGQASISATSDGVAGYGVVTVAPPAAIPANTWGSDASGTTSSLRAVWGASDTDAFAVGNDGTILRYNGTGWTAMTSGTTQPLLGVWGSSSNNVFAVGAGGIILRYNGSSWSQMTSPVSVLLRGVWGSGPNNVFAVGNAGTIIRFNGTSWTAMTSPTPEILQGVWGSSPTNVFAVGHGGAFLRYDGTSWTSVPGNPSTEDLWGVWGFSPTEVYSVGLNGTVIRYNGASSWTVMTSGTAGHLRDIWGTSGSDLYAVGDGGTVLRHGSSWSAMTSGTTALLEGVWGTQQVNSVYAVGGSGTIRHGARLGTVDSVDVTPGTATLTAFGNTQQLNAVALDANDNPLSGRTFAWTSRNEAVVTVDASGLVTAAGTGTAYVVGETSGKSDSAQITVAQVIESVEVTPPSATVGIGSTAQFSATARDANNFTVAGASFTWSSNDENKATVDNTGLVSVIAAGSATISATSVNNKIGTATVTGSVVPVATVTLSPASATIPVSGTVQLSAETRDASNNLLTGRAVTWSSNAPTVADVDAAGLVTGYSSGEATITGTSEGQTGTATITVSGSVVTSVVVTPSPSTLTAIGATVQLSAEARDAGNNPVGGKVFTWVSNSPSIATVDATGLVTAAGPGTVNIAATTDGISGNGSVTVAQITATVEVVPATGNIAVGQASQLTVIAKDANGHTIASPPAATWSTLDPDVVTVSASGVASAVALGSTTVSATIQGQSGSADITVVATPVATVEVTPAPTSVGEGQTVQLTATTKDGSNNVLTGRVIAWSSNSANATVSATGLVTGVTPGTATITAASEGKSGTSVVTITSRTVNSVVVTPRGARVTVPGGTQQFTAEALDVLNSPIPGKTFTWSSLNGQTATISPTTGVASVVANGQVTVGATVDGKTGYGLLTVAPGGVPVSLWDPETSNTANPLRAIWGSASDNAIAVGGTGGAATIQRWDGASWSAMTTAATAVLEGVWGTGGNNVFAVGQGGTILRYEGSSWASMTSGTTSALYDVWGNSPVRVYAVGAGGTMLFFNGTAWSAVSSGTTQDIQGIWGAASNDIWAVGNAGTLLRNTGGAWSATTLGTEDFRAVWGTATDDVWAVTAAGSIYHWDGNAWSAPVAAGAGLNTVWGSSTTDVYAAGAGGAVVRYDGMTWTPMVSGNSADLFGIWGRSGLVFAVGNSGTIHQGLRGASVLVSPANQTLVSLGATLQLSPEARDAQNNVIPGRTFTWGTSDGGVASVDAGGLVTAQGGGVAVITATTGGLGGNTNVTVAQVPVTVTVTPPNQTLTAFAATVQLTAEARDAGNSVIPGQSFTWQSSDDGIATVSPGGLVTAVSNGPVTITATGGPASGNTTVTVGQTTSSIVVTPAGATTTGATQDFDAQARDANGYEIAGKTFTWSSLNTGLATVDAVTGVATPVANGQVSLKAVVDGKAGYGVLTNTLPVGGGAINAWAGASTGTTNFLTDIWGPNSSDLHVVGAGGVIRHFNGAAWGDGGSPTATDLAGVWGAAADDIYAVGGAGSGLILRYNGTWSAVPSIPAVGTLRGVWGSGPTDVYAVGDNGAIVHYNGAQWSAPESPVAATLFAVWGTSRNDVWAVGNSGTIAHYNGSVWSVENPTAEPLYDIWGTSPTNVFAVGRNGVIFRYTGTWSPMTSPIPSGEHLSSVWGTTADDVYAVTEIGTVIRFNGIEWVRAGAAPGIALDGLFGASAYATGNDGVVYTGHRGTTVAVTPGSHTFATFASTQALTAAVNGGAVTGVPMVWTSSDPYVATVNSSTGEVTPVGRGTATITATTAGGATGTATISVNALRLGRVTAQYGAGNQAADQVFVNGDLAGTYTTIPVATFNAATPAQLRALYDVLLIPYYAGPGANLDWNTRLRPYLELGGGIISEDAISLSQMTAVVTGTEYLVYPSNPPGYTVSANVPGLTDGGVTGLMTGSHFRFTAWDAALTPYLTYDGTHGLYGRYGAGCIVFAPFNDWYGIKSGGAVNGNEYNVLINELKWTADCPLTAVAGPPASIVVSPDGATLWTFGSQQQFTAAVFDAVGNPISSPTVTWQSSDPDVLSITTNGLVQAIAGNGTVTVTATVTGGSNPSDVVTVVVNQAAATVEITPLGTTLSAAATPFSAVARNSNGDILTNKVFTWSSRNTAVATINPSSALLTPVSAGQSTISATVDAVSAAALLTVTQTGTAMNVGASQVSPTTATMLGVWGTTGSNVIGVGTSGTLARFNGSSWSLMTGSGTVTTASLWDLWGTSATDVFAVGSGCTLLRYNGVSWSTMAQSGLLSPCPTLYRVWGVGPGAAIAVGSGGALVRFDGTNWSHMAQSGIVTTQALYGVWGSALNDVYAVGNSGTLLHFDGTNWSVVNHGLTTQPLYAVWGSSSTDVFVVGENSTILHYNGSNWSVQTAPSNTDWFWDVYGTSANEVYAVGYGGAVAQYNGSSWSLPAGGGANFQFRGIWTTNDAGVFLGGSGGNLWRGVRGGAMSAAQVQTFVDNIPNSKMSVASNGSNYYTINGGTAATGAIWRYTTGGVFVSSIASPYDWRALLYAPQTGQFYGKQYNSPAWFTVNVLTGLPTQVWAGGPGSGFSNIQSSPAITPDGQRILENLGSTVKVISPSTGAWISDLSVSTSTSYAIATDGIYMYTWNGGTRMVYVWNLNTGAAVTNFTLPAGPNYQYSLSFTQNMLWASGGTTWYGHRLEAN